MNSAQGEKNFEWGLEAESIAADWLTARGYTIRERRWRAGSAIEIDLIAERDKTIVFVEVKARKGNVVSPLGAVNYQKMTKMSRGANIYLNSPEVKHLMKYRFDVITVTGNPDHYTVDHFEDAFLPPLSNR